MKFWLFFYNLFLPVGFLVYFPGLLWKLYHRPGWKKTFGERFGHFSAARRTELAAMHGCVWIHAVSVGESVIALALAKAWKARHPELPVVISTGTTTGQELVRKQAPESVKVIFCPLDFLWMVRKTLRLLEPRALVILETEIWPNLIGEARKSGVKVMLANARLSDHSSRGYHRFRWFFSPLLNNFDLVAAQSAADAERFSRIAPEATVKNCGNLKFDQSVPQALEALDLDAYFKTGKHLVLTAASTHSGEEDLLLTSFQALHEKFPMLKLVLVPRHAERGAEVMELVNGHHISGVRRSQNPAGCPEAVDCLVADTTGEMLKIMKSSDVVVMGKSLAGHDEGHNLIEPALLKKAIVTGSVLKNFRFLLKILVENQAVATVDSDAELVPKLEALLRDEAARQKLGEAAYQTISVHSGATDHVLDALDALLSCTQTSSIPTP